MVETIIQPVSPLLGTKTGAAGAAGAAAGAAAAVAAGAAAGAAASAAFASAGAATAGAAAGACAMTAPEVNKLNPRARLASSFFMSDFSLRVEAETSERFFAGFTGANAHNLLKVVDKDLAVADLAGAGSALNGLNHALNQVVGDGGLDLHLG